MYPSFDKTSHVGAIQSSIRFEMPQLSDADLGLGWHRSAAAAAAIAVYGTGMHHAR